MNIKKAKYCVIRLLDIDTENIAKDERSQLILDDAIRNVVAYIAGEIDTYYMNHVMPDNNNPTKIEETMKELNKIETNQVTKLENKITNAELNETKLTEINHINGPRYNYLVENKLDLEIATVADDDFNSYTMKPHELRLTTFNAVDQRLLSNTIHVTAELVKKNVYFGKPTTYTNILTNQQVIDYVNKFNELKPEYIKVYEYDNHNDEPAIVSTYFNPHIDLVDLCTITVKDDEKEHNKTLCFRMSFENMENGLAR